MGRLLGSLFDLRRNERPLAFLMALYHFLLLVSLYLLKPVRDSVFLSSRGAEELPFVFLLSAIVVLPVAVLHTRAGRRLHVGGLVDGVSGMLVVSLLGLRGLMGVGGEWVAYLLYAWVSIYGLLVTSQFWLLANALFTASQSKRVFTLLSAGAILGAIAGGEVTGLLVEDLGLASANLLWGAAGVMTAAMGVSWVLRRRAQGTRGEAAAGETQPEARPEATGAFSLIGDSRHLQLIVGGLVVMVIVTTLVDYQFKTVAARAYPSEQGLTTFMGHFYGRVSIVALLVQFVLAPRLMRVVGIGGALSVLPATLALGTVGMFVMPGLLAGIFLRGAGQSLKHSVDKTGRELLFVPLSLEHKKRVKVFVDLFVDQGAQGLGGLLLLGLAYGMGLGVQMLSLVTFALIVGWGVLTYWVRQTYVHQFREKLRSQNHDASSEAGEEERTPPDVDELLESLCGRVETEVIRALDTLEDSTGPVPVDALLCLLDHPSAAVRERTIRVLRVREVEGVADDVAVALRDPDPDVQLAAAQYLYCQRTDNREERLQQGLSHDDPQIRAATVGVIAEEGGVEEYRLVSEQLLRRLVETTGEQGREVRIQVARMLGVLDRPYRNELLHRLLQDEAPSVVRAALRAAAQTGDRAFVVPMIRALGNDACQAAAQEALQSFPSSIFGTLYDHLVDASLPLAVRTRLPAVIAAQPSRLAVGLLARSLSQVPIPVRHAVIRALSRGQQAATVPVDRDTIDEAIERESEYYAALGQVLRLHRQGDDGEALPLTLSQVRALRDETLERMFRLLGLRYDQRDLYDAYLGLTSDDPSLRDSAIEFVDNLVEYGTRRYLLPLLDDPDAEQAVTVGRQFFGLRIRDADAARRYLQSVDDPRLGPLLANDRDGPDVGAAPPRERDVAALRE